MIENSIVNFTMNHTKMYHNIVKSVKLDLENCIIQGHMKAAYHGIGIPQNNNHVVVPCKHLSRDCHTRKHFYYQIEQKVSGKVVCRETVARRACVGTKR